MKTSSMIYLYNCDHTCMSLIYDDTWDPDAFVLTMNKIHSAWDYISTLKNIWTDRLISAWWDLDLHAWRVLTQVQIFIRKHWFCIWKRILWYSWNVCDMRLYNPIEVWKRSRWYINITVIISVCLSYMMTHGIRM